MERAAFTEWLDAGDLQPVPMTDAGSIARELESEGFEALVIDANLAIGGNASWVLRGLGANRPMIVVGDADEFLMSEFARREIAYLSRPVIQQSLVLSILLALAEGRPARRFPRRQVPRLQASVEGIDTRILDVSYSGLRLELPDDHRAALPPYFNVRVPMFKVEVMVQRVWVNSSMRGSLRGNACCGVHLVRNADRAIEAWKTLVDNAAATGTVQTV